VGGVGHGGDERGRVGTAAAAGRATARTGGGRAARGVDGRAQRGRHGGSAAAVAVRAGGGGAARKTERMSPRGFTRAHKKLIPVGLRSGRRELSNPCRPSSDRLELS
jgi:hypothetical protein